MNLVIKNITQTDAVEILCWKYEAPYDFYNAMLTPDAILKLLGKSYEAVKNEEDELIGFFCVGKAATVDIGYEFGAYEEDCIDIGIGMKPELTGKGHGAAFFAFVLEYVQRQYPKKPLRLTVASFNKRAIYLYEKFGFVKERIIHGEIELITMRKSPSKE